MFTVSQHVINTVELTEDEAKELVKEYLQKAILGDGCYVKNDIELVHWTSWPHGSGTTTYKGAATKEQLAASELLEFLS